MAKENEFRFKSATVDPRKSIDAGFDLNTGQWQAMQDVDPYLKHVKLEREKQDYFGKTKHGYRKMATIPDIVAIKINEDHENMGTGDGGNLFGLSTAALAATGLGAYLLLKRKK